MSPRIEAIIADLIAPLEKTAALRMPAAAMGRLGARVGGEMPRMPIRTMGTPPGAPKLLGGANKPKITWANPAAESPIRPQGGGAATLSAGGPNAQAPGMGLASMLSGASNNAQALAGGLWRSIPWKRVTIPTAAAGALGFKGLRGLQDRAEQGGVVPQAVPTGR